MNQALFGIPQCSICLNIMFENLSFITCGHVYHTQCLEVLKLNKKSCPLCRTQFRKSHDMRFIGQESLQLVNKDLMPKCVAEKMQMFEDEIFRVSNEKLKLEELQQKKKQELESLKNKTNSNLISLLQDIDQNQNRICQFEQRIELLKKQSKAFKQQADYEEQFNLGVRPIGIQNKENKEQ